MYSNYISSDTAPAHDTRHYFSGPDIRRYSMLIIEDNKSDVLLVKKTMGGSFVMTNVPRIKDALNLFDEAAFDVIVLDLSLLDISGIAAVAAIHAAAPNTPIIVCSGTSDMRMKQDALTCGAKRYWVKGREPYDALKHMARELVFPAFAEA